MFKNGLKRGQGAVNPDVASCFIDNLRGDTKTSAIKKSERHSYGFPCTALQGFRGFWSI